jgi:ribosomal protein L21E
LGYFLKEKLFKYTNFKNSSVEVKLNIDVIRMIKRKQLRSRGKIKFSNYFRDFKEGEYVTVIRELAVQPKFPKQIQGRTGIIKSKRGESYVVKMNDLNKEKEYIIHPVHLRKIK